MVPWRLQKRFFQPDQELQAEALVETHRDNSTLEGAGLTVTKPKRESEIRNGIRKLQLQENGEDDGNSDNTRPIRYKQARKKKVKDKGTGNPNNVAIYNPLDVQVGLKEGLELVGKGVRDLIEAEGTGGVDASDRIVDNSNSYQIINNSDIVIVTSDDVDEGKEGGKFDEYKGNTAPHSTTPVPPAPTVSSSTPVVDKKGELVFQRYCHVYKKGELEDLCSR